MTMWGTELDELRSKLRDEADAFITSFASPPLDPSMPIAERIAIGRAGHDANVLRSENGVDREIAGPAGPLRLRTFVPEQVDAVFLHVHGGGFIAGELCPGWCVLFPQRAGESLVNFAIALRRA